MLAGRTNFKIIMELPGRVLALTVISLVVVNTQAVIPSNTTAEPPPAENQDALILKKILMDYDNRLLPSQGATNVSLNFLIQKIINMDLFTGTVTLGIFLKTSWNDPRLQWDRSSFNNVSSIRLPLSDIWQPDLALYGSDDTPKGVVGNIDAVVYDDGTVFAVPSLVVKTSCNITLDDYPYDTQECPLKWGSWTHESSRINMITDPDPAQFEFFFDNPAWEIVEASTEKHSTTYDCCPDNAYDDVTLTLKLRRAETHGRIAPAVLASWLILAVFFLGPQSGDKRVIFGGLVFLTLTMLTALLSFAVPMSSTTRLGRYQLAGMLITAIITVINAVLDRIYPHNGEDRTEMKAASKFFMIVDVIGFGITVVLLAIVTGALFAA